MEEGVTEQAKSDYLSTLEAVLAEERPSSAYHYGHARLDVLHLLVATLPTGSVQAMVMGAEIPEAARLEFRRQGVIFWEEGGHAADLIVRDYRWTSIDQLKRAVEWGGRRPPRIYFLAGDAVNVDRPDSYAWVERDGCWIGRQGAEWKSQST